MMADDWENRFYENLGRWLCVIAQNREDGCSLDETIESLAHIEFSWRQLTSKCQSPIEHRLAAEFLFLNDGYSQFQFDHAEGVSPPEFMTLITPQAKVGRFTVDFLFSCHLKGKVDHVVVECDGHDFHEKTKDQAQRDKSRDRDLAAKGYTVLRFTGSEIYRDSKKCAEEVESLVQSKMDKLVKAL